MSIDSRPPLDLFDDEADFFGPAPAPTLSSTVASVSAPAPERTPDALAQGTSKPVPGKGRFKSKGISVRTESEQETSTNSTGGSEPSGKGQNEASEPVRVVSHPSKTTPKNHREVPHQLGLDLDDPMQPKGTSLGPGAAKAQPSKPQEATDWFGFDSSASESGSAPVAKTPLARPLLESQPAASSSSAPEALSSHREGSTQAMPLKAVDLNALPLHTVLAQPRRREWDDRVPGALNWVGPALDNAAFARMGITPFEIEELPLRTGFSEIVFVGDPHMVSAERAPGRRLDGPQFHHVVAGKLRQIAAICRTRKARMASLGDFFDQADDNGLEMLSVSMLALAEFEDRPLTLVGNHEKLRERLTDNTALGVLRAAKSLDTLEGSALFEVYRFGDQLVGLGGTGHGNPIPQDLRELRNALGLSQLLWMTHHDLEFGSSYPGALPIEEIQGVDLMVNGHMHLTKKPERRGNMMAWNPGNITRMSIDTSDHEPAVWAWNLQKPQWLEKIPLVHEKNVFNRTGKMAKEAAPNSPEQQAAELMLEESLFVSSLSELAGAGNTRTNDASELWEDARDIFAAKATPLMVRQAFTELMRETLEFLPSAVRNDMDHWEAQALESAQAPAADPSETQS